MTDSITLTGLVATTPRHIRTNDGLTISSFRLASAQRRFDRTKEKWIDVDTNWYTISAFRQLGVNCTGSVNKGDRVIVSGRLRIREWQNGERTGTTVDIEADAIGHDLSWGTSSFSRTISSGANRATDDVTAPVLGGSGGDPAEGWESSTAPVDPIAGGDGTEDHDVDSYGNESADGPARDEADALALPF
ncbi:single-stranded DNA-binding protein [Salinibacterium sp.]|uniref:single-stranded DNA-binding protein n=1 Tax=Salinibacterium sp. TaxID=1915057 RepID=UPI00286BED44|nr:single-stranded DNA-binding protein [Salinibacterium sp.]